MENLELFEAYNDGTIIDPLPLYELYESPVIPNELLDII